MANAKNTSPAERAEKKWDTLYDRLRMGAHPEVEVDTLEFNEGAKYAEKVMDLFDEMGMEYEVKACEVVGAYTHFPKIPKYSQKIVW